MSRFALRLAAAAAAPALLATPAAAFDCARAATASEKAICADSGARAADADLGKAFEALRAATPAGERAALVAAQARWIESRDSDCADKKGGDLSACLRDKTGKRAAFLKGAPESGPGSPNPLAPVFRQQKGGKGRADIDIQMLRFAAPANEGEKAFNAASADLVKDVVEPEMGDPSDTYAYQWSMRLAYASPRLLSAHVSGYQFSGGAHPNSMTANLNLDVSRGRMLAFADLAAKPAAEKIFGLCLAQVRQQKADKGESPEDMGDPKELKTQVAEATGDLKSWSFGLDKATIDYDPYAVGAYAEGAFDCAVPYATLKPLAKPDFPLP